MICKLLQQSTMLRFFEFMGYLVMGRMRSIRLGGGGDYTQKSSDNRWILSFCHSMYRILTWKVQGKWKPYILCARKISGVFANQLVTWNMIWSRVSLQTLFYIYFTSCSNMCGGGIATNWQHLFFSMQKSKMNEHPSFFFCILLLFHYFLSQKCINLPL